MSMTSDIFNVLVAAAAPTSLDEIMEALPDSAGRNTVCTILAQRKRAGEVIANVEDGKVHYAVSPDYDGSKRRGERRSQGKSSDTPPAKKTTPRRERRHDPLAAVDAAQNLLKALEFNRDTARNALQLYVTSVADLSVYTGLQDALNGAQAALEAFTAGGSA